MHVNWKSGIEMPALEEPAYREALKDLVRDATDDDLLAAFLYETEGEVVCGFYEDAYEFWEEAEAESAAAGRLRPAALPMPLQADHARACDRLREQLDAELASADRLQETLEALVERHHARGGSVDLLERYRNGAPPPAALEEAGALHHQVEAARRRVEEELSAHAQTMHDIALREKTHRAFAAGPASIPLSALDALTHAGFERAVAKLARRDKLTVLQGRGGPGDLGADVIALAPDGRRIVIQCKHRSGHKVPWGTAVVQTLNGTARPVHKADIVIVAANSTFTRPAQDLARDQRIHLLGRGPLESWATWGVPLLEIVNQDT